MREIADEIHIAASPEQVWAVLTDFASFPQWNPFITDIAGRPETGTTLDVRIAPPGGRAMRFRPTVIRADPGRELAWLGRLFVRGLFDGEHHFQLDEVGSGHTRFVQREVFTGVLTRFTPGVFDRTLAGFRAMNRALAERVETRP